MSAILTDGPFQILALPHYGVFKYSSPIWPLRRVDPCVIYFRHFLDRVFVCFRKTLRPSLRNFYIVFVSSKIRAKLLGFLRPLRLKCFVDGG